jgi:hypothetical protein
MSVIVKMIELNWGKEKRRRRRKGRMEVQASL